MKRIILLFVLTLLNQAIAQDIVDKHADQKREAKYKAEIFQHMLANASQQTQNQEHFDVKHYELNLKMDVQQQQIIGHVSVLAEVVDQPIDRIELNLLSNMIVDSAYFENEPTNFYHSNDILKIALDREYQPGEKVRVTTFYHGHPRQTGFGAFGFDSRGGQPMIWSLSQPYGARNWWPCKDFPSDKADSADIIITVPEGLIVASNGLLREETEHDGLKTYWWHESYPIVTYLISVAIHPYHVYSDYYKYSDTDSMEVQFYIFPDHIDYLRDAYAKTVGMIEIFSEIYGPYPFLDEKYGHAEFLGGANMEHQTISSMRSRRETTIAHELAHQWWGDMITCDNFYHIWINEGFATYSEALYLERKYGKNEFWEEVNSNKHYGPGTIYVQDLDEIFHYGRSYQKGSWVLHMLRHVVGDSTFFQILKTYYNDERFRYSTATTEDFQEICETVSGMDLDKFFHQWIYEEYFPRYSYAWNWVQNGSDYNIQLDIEQTQENYIFWMPIDITITTASSETTFVVVDSLKNQRFHFTLNQQPQQVELDKFNWILKQVQEPINNATFDKGILLVNGVNFYIYGSEIYNAYQNHAFWGEFPITFWDCFDPPPAGYPSSLPEPLGKGRIPADILSQYSTVIWVGNNYDGDLTPWTDTSILSYLKAGGNVLLLSRLGQDFIDAELQDYLGIQWAENAENQTRNCVATYPGLQTMTLIGTQTYNAVFDTSLISVESELLFKETASFSTPRGLGVWRKPENGGAFRSDGGQFVFISGRPYRYNGYHLRENVEFILESFFLESKASSINNQNSNHIKQFELAQNFPNPFNPGTEISFFLPERSKVKLEIFDTLGRKVATLLSDECDTGKHTVNWLADDAASGVYFYKLTSAKFTQTRKMILLR